MSVLHKGKNSIDKGVESFKTNLTRNPDDYIQPTISIEKFTRKEFVNPEFVKRYGNPYNKSNPKSIYLEDSESDVSDKILVKEKREEIIHSTIERTQHLLYFANEESSVGIPCKLCLASNDRNNILCFNCSNPMMISKAI